MFQIQRARPLAFVGVATFLISQLALYTSNEVQALEGPPLPVRQPAPASAPITECDRLTNKSDHPDAVLPVSVGFWKITPSRAIEACVNAARSYPRHRRFHYLLGRAYARAGQFEAAHTAHLIAAHRGDPYAMLALARMAAYGKVEKPDLFAAAKWVERAARTTNPEALTVWSGFHRLGLGVHYNARRSFELALKAAASGWPYALNRLAHLYRHGIGTDRDPEHAERIARRAFQLEQPKARNGEPISMLRIGWALLHGRGVKKDRAAGLDWVHKAEAAGLSDSASSLGWMYRSGLGVPTDVDKACDYFEQSAKRLFPNAMNSLALCYKSGKGRPKDLTRAKELFEQSTIRGNRHAARNLARLYLNGIGVKGNLRTAARLYKTAAERGLSAAMVQYGNMLSDGHSVPRNDKTACDWYERAKAVGHSAAINNLAICYARGKGRPKDQFIAVRLLKQAAKAGSIVALRNLAERYEEGNGVDKNLRQANQLFKQAADKGDNSASVQYGLNLFNGHGVERNLKLGCDYFEKAAKRNDATAINNLATCFVSGEGRAKNTQRALALFEQSVRLNNALAMWNLAHHLFKGDIVTKDDSRALALLKSAAQAGESRAIYDYAKHLFSTGNSRSKKSEACRWFDEAAQHESTFAASLIFIGTCWEHGWGRMRSRRRAFRAYKASAESGDLIGMRLVARAYDEAIGTRRNGNAAATWLRRAMAAGNVFVAQLLISDPYSWHRSTRKALQRILRSEGHYRGPIDGRFTAEMDTVIWNRAVGDSAKFDGQRLKQEIVRVKTKEAPKGLPVRICSSPDRQDGNRVIIINHGTTSRRSRRRIMRPTACGEIAEFFVRRGFIVAFPLRRGYGATSSGFAEGARGKCRSWRFTRAGSEMARDVSAVLNHLLKRNDVKQTGAIIMGHSGGGWASIALSSKSPGPVAGYINFSGGHGSNKGVPGTYCPSSLTAAMSRFGKTSRKPTLWLYVKNDSYIGPRVARRFFRAFRKTGGVGTFVLLNKYEDEGHYVFSDDTVSIWGPPIDKWLITNMKQAQMNQSDHR
ncbi:MAG: hypothetical protein AAGB04_10015 [Pseudomonadota bacterium]